MSKFIAKAYTMAFVATVSMTAIAADAPGAFTPNEFAAIMAKMPTPTELGGVQVHAKQFCGSCHGSHGVAQTANWPHVAGQPRDVTIKALLDYREGRRNEGAAAAMMAAVAKRLSDQEIVDVALLYENIDGPDGTKLKVGKPEKTTGLDSDVKRLLTRGDPARAITPCAACHGTTGNGNLNGQVPVLHGQNPTYLATALKEYRSGARTSDILKEMRFFASQLNDREIEQLSVYYGDLKGWKAKSSE